MSKFAKFMLPLLAAFVFMGLYSISVYAAGPTPKIVVPLEKSFYLTPTGYWGNEVLTACAAGYHFASVFEIRELTPLSYNTDLGLTLADSGSGPPAGEFGWVRSGEVSNAGNCYAWTSKLSSDLGTVAELNLQDMFQGEQPWNYAFSSCYGSPRVWCVSDSEY